MKPMNRRTERLLWVGVSTFLVACVLGLLLSPTVLAESPSDDSESLIESFEQVFRYVEENFVDEKDPQQLMQGAVKGLFESLDDPHSSYLSPSEMEGLSDITSGQFGGVGMYISQGRERDGEGPFIEVVEPIPDTPAFRGGVRVGDEIISVEGESTEGLTTEDVANRLRGPRGTEVTFTVRRGTESIEFTLEREEVEVPTVRDAMIEDEIGFMRVSSFTPFTAERMREAVASFEAEGYSGLVMDLRGNTGGLLRAAIDAANLFMDEGLIVGTTSRIEHEDQEHYADSGSTVVPSDIPVVVLVNGASASGAEILAGALQDSGRAVVVGENTFGKGSVQQVHRTGAIEGGFRLTLSRYYTPDGTYIDKDGIVPDHEEEEPRLSTEEENERADLMGSGRIDDFLDRHDGDPGEEALDEFVSELGEEYELGESWMRRIVREERLRRQNVAPVYDLDWDTVLQKAVQLIRDGEVAVKGE